MFDVFAILHAIVTLQRKVDTIEESYIIWNNFGELVFTFFLDVEIKPIIIEFFLFLDNYPKNG